MDLYQESYVLELWEQNICPTCGETISEGMRVGTGRKSDGGFCSLDCYAKFYEVDLVERQTRLTAAVRNKES